MSEQERFKILEQSLSEGGTLLYAGALLARAARLFPHKIAVMIDEQKKITYQQLYSAASAVSSYLIDHGIKSRDRVLMLYENSIDFYIIYYGIWQTGAVVVPVNTFLHEKELEHIIADSQPTKIFVSDELAPKLSQITFSAPLISQQELQTIIAHPTAFEPRSLDQHELSALLYTSGTTGLPKGVMLSSHNIMSNLIQGASRFQIMDDERIYCALPLFHSFTQNTCVWSSFAAGSTVILVPKITRSLLLAGLALKPTIVLGVPGLYGLFCRLKNCNFDSARYLICGGDALPDKIRMYFAFLYGRNICNGYGLSETGPFVSVDLDDVVSPTHTVGKPFIGIDCQIRDGKPIGTLWVKGPNVMLGYYNTPEATQAILIDGWLNTGDLAMIDEFGKIVICGREKDLIAHKGIKIYPQEVENVLMAHASVLTAAVIGIKNGGDEEFPVAYIMLKEPLKNVNEELTTFCQQHLAPYKIPRQFFVVESLPLTATGKVDKKELHKNHPS